MGVLHRGRSALRLAVAGWLGRRTNHLRNHLLLQFSLASFSIMLALAVGTSTFLVARLNRNIELLTAHGVAMDAMMEHAMSGDDAMDPAMIDDTVMGDSMGESADSERGTPADSTENGFIEDTDPFSIMSLTADIQSLRRSTYLLIAGGFLVLYLSLVSIVHRGWRTIRRQQTSLSDVNRELLATNEALIESEKQLTHDALHDELTELPNRALFTDRLSQSIEHAKRRQNYLFAVLFLDFDRFKNVNDFFGHPVGDELLVALSRRLAACIRSADTLARLGGDEFAILLDDIEDVRDSARVADRIREELTEPFKVNGHEVLATASIGITLSAISSEQPDDMLRDADIAMYRAKEAGGARYELFNTDMYSRVMAQLKMETELRRAAKRQEFRLHYQPIVSLKTGELVGFEALLRWQHPDRGLVAPAEFLSLMEETGLIVTVGKWVLREACRQLREWQVQFPARPPLAISVNLSNKEFSQPDLAALVQRSLNETGLDAQSLRLEITETVIMANTKSAITALSELQALGVRLHMDDFGTGHSSLSALHRFPIDTLKIDRSFVHRIGVGGENGEILRTISALAHDLGLDLIAEGVETSDQLAQLKLLKCEQAQGYFFSKPLDAKSAEELIGARPQWHERSVGEGDARVASLNP